MKRTAILVLVVLLACCAALTGCQPAAEVLSPKHPTTVMVWHYYNGTQKEAFDALVNEFNETVGQTRGIVVTAESKGSVNDLAAAVMDSAQKKVGSDEFPHLVSTYVDTAYSLYRNNMLADLDSYMTQEERDRYVPAFLEEGRMGDGKHYVLPVAKSTELLYINQTDWDRFAQQTGADEALLSTWEGIAALAQQYYEWSGGKAFFGRDAFANYVIVGSQQLGVEIFSVNDGKVTVQLDEAVMKRLWDAYAVPYIKGHYGAYGRFRSDDVKTGDLIACVSSTSSISYFPKEVTLEDGSTYPIQSRALPLPNFEGTKPYAVQQGAGMAIAKSDKQHETAAVEFLKWFTEAQRNTQFAVSTGYLPVQKEAVTEANMSAALKANGMEEGNLSYQNAMVSIGQIGQAELYTNLPFEDGNAVRNLLTEAMTDSLNVYRAQWPGIAQDSAQQQLDLWFAQWLTDLQGKLQH